MSRREGAERGSATGFALGAVALVLVVSLGAVAGARVLITHRTAGAAADLGALAGAVALQRGQDGCGAAQRLVERHGAVTVSCRETDQEVRLIVSVDVGRLLGRTVAVTARAHAGPR